MQRLDTRYRHWLESLEVESPVAVVSGSSVSKYRITTVENIDRLRRTIRVKALNEIFEDGDYNEGLLGDHYWLAPVTDEIREYIYREELIRKIKNADLKTLSTGRLESLVGLLE
jgi:hypothetical protein